MGPPSFDKNPGIHYEGLRSDFVMNFPDFSSLDLSPKDFCIRSALEQNAYSKPHRNSKSFKKFLVKK